MQEFDIIVVGAGHAGCEAALASARMGMKTAVFTISLDNIGVMSCNPSLGGPAKSHLAREIDALGGEMGRNIDKTFIQIRVLNTKKGPAVRSLRAQADKMTYANEMKKTLEHTDNLTVIQGMVSELVVEEENGKKVIKGIKIREGLEYRAKIVILATGTFLRGLIHIGEVNFSAGRMGELSSEELPLSLEKVGLKLGRFKTGTPARIDGRTIDFSVLEEQPGDKSQVLKFSNRTTDEEALSRRQISCYIAHTNDKVHEIIKNARERSPMFNGKIQGLGPRYCPSIEDKVNRFAEKERHQLFIEPEGLETDEMYIQGMSSSLPEDVQRDFYHSIEGLENIVITRPAYAIEYDCIDPLELKLNLESRSIEKLFCAGQFNGSSGYEEAAAQGLMAGINAHLAINGKEPFALARNEAYIGVLIDDLVTKGTNEPYRIMTSRAEYRLLLRQDNADDRLTAKSYEIGLASEERFNRLKSKQEEVAREIDRLKSVMPTVAETNSYLEKINSSPVDGKISLADLLKRPEVTYENLKAIDKERPEISEHARAQVSVEIKYQGYIKKQIQQVEKFKKLEKKPLSGDIDYEKIDGLRIEAAQKMNKIKPVSLGQASRISGVSPADINVLQVYLEKEKRIEKARF